MSFVCAFRRVSFASSSRLGRIIQGAFIIKAPLHYHTTCNTRQHAVALRVGQVIELARAYGEAHRGLEHGRQELFQARGHAREVARGQSDGLLLRDPTAGQVEHRREREREGTTVLVLTVLVLAAFLYVLYSDCRESTACLRLRNLQKKPLKKLKRG